MYFGHCLHDASDACTIREIQLGEELEQKGDCDGAVAAYREAIRKDPLSQELEEKLKAVKIRAAEQHFPMAGNC